MWYKTKNLQKKLDTYIKTKMKSTNIYLQGIVRKTDNSYADILKVHKRRLVVYKNLLASEKKERMIFWLFWRKEIRWRNKKYVYKCRSLELYVSRKAIRGTNLSIGFSALYRIVWGQSVSNRSMEQSPMQWFMRW